eukprot:1389167-Pyramimonas_sp.AAC.1
MAQVDADSCSRACLEMLEAGFRGRQASRSRTERRQKHIEGYTIFLSHADPSALLSCVARHNQKRGAVRALCGARSLAIIRIVSAPLRGIMRSHRLAQGMRVQCLARPFAFGRRARVDAV